MVAIHIVDVHQWGAKQPKAPAVYVPASTRIIFHHTDGHHPEIENPANESLEEAVRYAQDIQHFHMAPKPKGRDWNDSGHNFLVCRNGLILQGRWRTVSAIENRQMVESAHCPGQNDQVGIEHEHKGKELMTLAQLRSSARLMAWIADQYGRDKILLVSPHKDFYPTECPANLIQKIPTIKRLAQKILTTEGGL